ncbi:MAG: hypothetical protein LBJ67_14610 [Planctomycetaceae bacterium]|nr:hypothetical protein [Planctomycetaceae bacterium]
MYAQGEEVVVWVLLQLAASAKRGEAIKHPLSTPSSSLPVYEKEPSKQRRQKSVAKQGHRGTHRSPPQKITHHQEHHASCCPDCGGALRLRKNIRKRYIEDIPANITAVLFHFGVDWRFCLSLGTSKSPIPHENPVFFMPTKRVGGSMGKPIGFGASVTPM